MIRTFSFPYRALQVTAEDLERQIGPASVNSGTAFADVYDEVLKDAACLIDIRAGYRVIEAMDVDKENNILHIGAVTFHVGPVIVQQLNESSGVIVFACTAGEAVTREARRFFSFGDPLKGYLYDIVGSVCVEKAADLLEAEAKNEAGERGMHISRRLSPGYCGWQVGEQHRLFSLLPKDFCGIRVSTSSLMYPMKSVSGMIGLGKHTIRPSRPCLQCADITCTSNRRRST